MSPASVVFDGVWKKFRKGERHDSLRDLVPATFARFMGRRQATELQDQEFWALRDVSFEVNPGEALGIIGPNGAGKSTTLKLLTRILKPTRGHCSVRGRIGALIEVAAGFHPDLTGRENVYLQGSIMGMSRTEVAAAFDEIVDFAGVADFVDTPVKRYSSGMNARLGFSIAAHLRPDVLIIDEVLSVGDAAFQDRCLSRMERFRNDGVTIVFVSHNLQAVNGLCTNAIYMNRSIRAMGAAAGVLDSYVRTSFAQQDSGTASTIRIDTARLLDGRGQPISQSIASGTAVQLVVSFETRQPLNDLELGLLVHRATDKLTVYRGHFLQDELGIPASEHRFIVAFSFNAHVARGQYFLDVFVRHRPTQEVLARLVPAGHLAVHETRTTGCVADLGASAKYGLREGPAILSVPQAQVPTHA